MLELLSMLERLVPSIRETRTWRQHAMRWVRNLDELKRLQTRRPELYAEALNALVHYIADRAQREIDGDAAINDDLRHHKAVQASLSRRKG